MQVAHQVGTGKIEHIRAVFPTEIVMLGVQAQILDATAGGAVGEQDLRVQGLQQICVRPHGRAPLRW